ncbi:hypothetical protein K456DRAFT_56406 [Colletotrichum gloeosporioides 23]|nr:hypothetical protein K456DRAFT_56406 [Colletotrichum gloeosporioides 23]
MRLPLLFPPTTTTTTASSRHPYEVPTGISHLAFAPEFPTEGSRHPRPQIDPNTLKPAYPTLLAATDATKLS